MSIDFSCPAAPKHMVALDPTEPEFKEECSTLPSINLSKRNASAFLRLMHLPAQPEGQVNAVDLPAVSRRLILVANSEKTQALEHMPYTDDLSHGKLRIPEQAHRDSYFRETALKLLELFTKASEHGYPVAWS